MAKKIGGTFQVEMVYDRDTPGTYVYISKEQSTSIPTLYIKKTAPIFFENKVPKGIVVTILAV